jgi:hypothetical protein
MQQISSKLTFLQKRVLPLVWFGVALVGVAVPLVIYMQAGSFPPVETFIVPAVMVAFGYFIMKMLVFDLVDAVWDDGDALIVRNGGQEERIALADIMNVSYSQFTRPQRVTLSLRRPSIFGDKVTFCAPERFIPLTANPQIDELIRRIDAARQRRR